MNAILFQEIFGCELISEAVQGATTPQHLIRLSQHLISKDSYEYVGYTADPFFFIRESIEIFNMHVSAKAIPFNLKMPSNFCDVCALKKNLPRAKEYQKYNIEKRLALLGNTCIHDKKEKVPMLTIKDLEDDDSDSN